MNEVAIHWADEWPSVSGRCRDYEQNHALETIGQLMGTQSSFVGEDLAQVNAGIKAGAK